MSRPFQHALESFQTSVDGAIADAVASSNYERVQVLAELAATLRATWKRLDAQASFPTPSADSTRPEATRSEESAKVPVKYPYYLRDELDVLKVGWASKVGATYEHRAPFADVKLFAGVVAGLSSSGALFTTKELRSRLEAEWKRRKRDPLPDSQFYVCLGWLKWIGVIVQHGRRGYSIADKRMLGDGLETAFTVLPTSRQDPIDNGER